MNDFSLNCNELKPDLYKRFTDDCVGDTSSSREKLNQFIASVNSLHSTLKYSRETSENLLGFLDIKLLANGNASGVRYKTTDSHNYLLHSSSHSQHITEMSSHFLNFLDLVVSMCSDNSNAKNKCEDMCQIYKKHSYPDSSVT